MTKKRLQILDKSQTLTSVEAIDSFLKEVLTKTRGWLDPHSLWEVENPYDVFNRMEQLGLKVYTYKKKNAKTDVSTLPKIVKGIEDNYIAVCQYNPSNNDENFLQDLYITHWLDGQCYFTKVGPHNICCIHNNQRVLKVFPGEFIVKHSYEGFTISIISKKDLESGYTKEH